MSKKLKTSQIVGAIRISIMTFVTVGLVFGSSTAGADQYQDQINALQQQNNTTQTQVDGLANQAASYQDQINQLDSEISSLQAALSINENKQAAIENQITADQNNIVLQKKLLGDEVRSLYMDGQLTPVEELATSNSLSDYVDKQAYNTDIQSKIGSLITTISTEEKSLQQQKQQLTILINTQTQQNGQLESDQGQQQQLLAYNQAQQATYNQQIQSNQAQIAVLRQEQIVANEKLVHSNGGSVLASGTCGGGYPASATNNYGANWGCDYPLDNTLDNWGMYNRECVSYTAWKVYQTYGYMPYWGGSGDANEWPADAAAAGIPTGTVPKVGSVAIYMGGAGDPWGHAMWVDSVDGNGMITVSQYNLYYDGNYYQTTIDGSGLVYIYFGG